MKIATLAFGATITLLAGAVLTESIFAWPGLGRYVFRASTSQDFPAIMGVSIYPLFLVIDHGVMIQALMIQTGLAILIGMIQGPLPAFMVECFPVNNRYTAIGLSYNITLALFGGTAPMVATWLIKVTGNIASPALYLAVLAVISVVAMATLKPLERPA